MRINQNSADSRWWVVDRVENRSVTLTNYLLFEGYSHLQAQKQHVPGY